VGGLPGIPPPALRADGAWSADSIKTVRNVIDWHFRALYRDAREELEEQESSWATPSRASVGRR